MPQPAELRRLLDRLCAQLGFCLPPDEQARLAEHPPDSVDAFADALFAAEGLDPATADRHLYRQVRDIVREAFRGANDTGSGDGMGSGVNARAYPCGDYLTSECAASGVWDERAQLWLIVPLSDVEELIAERFLVVGRPGVDGIAFGYRRERPGFWAYHPVAGEYQLLAASMAEFLDGWRSGTITV